MDLHVHDCKVTKINGYQIRMYEQFQRINYKL